MPTPLPAKDPSIRRQIVGLLIVAGLLVLALVVAANFRKPVPIILGILVATVVNHAVAGASHACCPKTEIHPVYLAAQLMSRPSINEGLNDETTTKWERNEELLCGRYVDCFPGHWQLALPDTNANSFLSQFVVVSCKAE